MILHRADTEDAIRIYTLAIAYLHDARIGNFSQASTLHVKEEWGGVFYIWRRSHSSFTEEPVVATDPVAPVAVCTYKMETNTWKVALSSGTTLALVDKGNIWDIAEEVEDVPDPKVAKGVMRWYRAKGQSKRPKWSDA